MKKTLSLILALCICLSVVASITGCNSGTDDPKHTHTYEASWSFDKEYHWHSCEDESCLDVSQKAAHSFENGICVCGYTEEALGHTHTFDTNWSHDETYHWYACEDESCSEVSQKVAHSFNNGICVCGYEKEALVHNHTFKTDWSYDETHHWHICEGENCSEISDKAEHTWNDGEITVEPTKESDGVKTFSCTDCGQTKTETVKYTVKTTVTMEEWKSAFDDNSFTNVTVSLSMDEDVYFLVSNTGTAILLDGYYQELGDNYFFRVYLEKSGEYGFVEERDSNGTLTRVYAEQEELAAMKEAGFIDIRGLGWYLFLQSDWLLPNFSTCFSSFSYDAVNNVYVANNILSERIKINDEVSSDPVEYEYVKVKFEDGKLIRLELKMTDGDAWILEYNSYGTTVINKDGEQNIHTYKPKWLYDDTHHWHSCSVTGCSEIFEKNTHSFVNGVCVCGYEEEIPTHSHTFETIWSYDEEYHWYACEDESCSEVSQRSVHSFVSGICTCGYEEETLVHTHPLDEFYECTVCDYAYGSPCLEYELNEDQVSYSVIGCNSESAQEIIIPAIYEGLPVTNIANQSFYNNDFVTKVVIGKNVNIIGFGAFCRCKNLSEVVMGNNITHIYGGAFRECELLKEISIPDNVLLIDFEAFLACISLEQVTIGNKVTNIGIMAFMNCTALKSLVIGDGVEEIGDAAFLGCEELTAVYINDLSTWCNINFVDPTSNPLFSEFFDWDEIPKKKLYVNSTLLTELVIPEDITEVKPYSFCRYQMLTSVAVSNNVEKIGEFAFENCNLLETVVIGDGVELIDKYAFIWCDNLSSLSLGKNVHTIEQQAFEGSAIETLTLPESIIEIKRLAFNECFDLNNIYYEGTKNEWKQVKIKTEGNDAILTATIHYLGVPSASDGLEFESNGDGTCIVKGIGDCTDTDIIIPAISPEGDQVTGIWGSLIYGKGAFTNCENITSVVIPDGVVEIGACAFGGCKNLMDINIPSSVEKIGGIAFYECNKLIEIVDGVHYVGKWVVGFDTSIKNIVLREGTVGLAWYAAMDCYDVENIDIPDSVLRIPDFAFADCSNASIITLGNGIISIGMDAFMGNKITSIVIPEGVTHIELGAFASCSLLKEIVLPKTLIYIGYGAFAECVALTDVYFCCDETQWTNITIEECNFDNSNIIVHFNYNN